MIVLNGARIVEQPKRSHTRAGLRVCSHEGCTTRLSAYNSEERCFVHRTHKPPRLRGKNSV